MVLYATGGSEFPKRGLLFLLPNLLLLAYALWRSAFAVLHVGQAVIGSVAGLVLSAVPEGIRWLAWHGYINGVWFRSAGYDGSKITPLWALDAAILIIGGLLLFAGEAEAISRGFTGQPFQWPLIGRLLTGKRIRGGSMID